MLQRQNPDANHTIFFVWSLVLALDNFEAESHWKIDIKTKKQQLWVKTYVTKYKCKRYSMKRKILFDKSVTNRIPNHPVRSNIDVRVGICCGKWASLFRTQRSVGRISPQIIYYQLCYQPENRSKDLINVRGDIDLKSLIYQPLLLDVPTVVSTYEPATSLPAGDY